MSAFIPNLIVVDNVFLIRVTFLLAWGLEKAQALSRYMIFNTFKTTAPLSMKLFFRLLMITYSLEYLFKTYLASKF